MRAFAAIIVLLMTFTGRAQEGTGPVFSFKPALGINACQVHGDNYSGFDKFGVFGGAAINARLSDKTSLELGFYFSQKGARHNQNPEKGDYDFYRLHLDYIDLPLSFRFFANEKYFFTLGPSFAYLFNYKENINYTDFTGFYNFNPYEIGLNIGLGRMINDKISVEVRSSNSIKTIRDYGRLSNVFYPNPVARFFNKGFYNNIITVFVAYHLDLRKKSG